MDTVFKGKIFTIKQYTTSDGRLMERCERPASVEIIPITKNTKILMTFQLRPTYPKGIYAFPGGRLDEGEDRLQAAQRELQEEAGVKAGTLELFHENIKTNSFKQDYYIYIARDLVASKLPEDVDEIIETKEISIDELFELALAGQIFPDINCVAAFKLKALVDKGKPVL